MSKIETPVPEAAGSHREDTTHRRCLRCDSRFPSEWFGERICQQCKKTTAWRMGDPKVVHMSKGSR